MRLATTILLTLLFCSAAWADGTPPTTGQAIAPEAPQGLPGYGLTTLVSEEVERAIEDVIQRTAREEGLLLEALVASTDEAECQRIIEQITALDLRRDLAILRIQVRCARNRGLWELEHALLERIDELTATAVVALP